MLYELCLFYNGGSHHAVLKDVKLSKSGIIYGTQVGRFVAIDDNGNFVYAECVPTSYTAGGGAFTLTNFTGKLKKS